MRPGKTKFNLVSTSPCRRKGRGGLLVFALLTAALAGFAVMSPLAAAKKAPMAPSIVWPPPPAESRIGFVRTISGVADLGVRPSAWSRLANLATGAGRGKEKWVKPFGIALDEQDNLCLTDMGSGRVWYFDRARKHVQSWDKAGRFAFTSPVAIAKANGVFYVADSVLGKIVAFDEKGRFKLAIDRELTRPAGLAVFGGKLFVADTAAHNIAVFDLNGNLLSKFGKRGAGQGELNFPTHIAVNTKGRLLVTDSMNARIQQFDAEGRLLGVVGSAGDGSGHFSRPKGVAADSFGNVYVVDALFDNVQIFNKEGRFLLAVGEPGSSAGQFWMPSGIAIGRNGSIFVADSYNARVQEFQFLGKP